MYVARNVNTIRLMVFAYEIMFIPRALTTEWLQAAESAAICVSILSPAASPAS